MTVHRGLLFLLLVTVACGDGGGSPALCEVRSNLVDHTLWAAVPGDVDPFRPSMPDAGANDPSGSGRCPAPDSMHFEDFGGEPSFTINTQRCHWGTVEQPAAISVKQGDPINLRVWYFSQSSFDETQATVHVAIGDDPFWTKTVPLPSPTGGLFFDSVPAPRDIAVGEVLRWNVSNHGSNTWNLLEISRLHLEPCAGDAG